MDIVSMVRKSQNKIVHDIYINKIYLMINSDIDNSDKLAYTEGISKGLNARIDKYLETNSDSDYNLLFNDFNSVMSLLKELREDIINKQSFASVVLLDNLKEKELNKFYNIFCEVYKKYSTIEQASSDIFYHSGLTLSEFVIKLIKYVETHECPNNKFIPLNYLKDYTAIITLDFNNWVKLINTLKSSMKYLASMNDAVINKLREDFELIFVYYFIVITGENI